MPALSWQGLNPVDDTGDGFPDTLASGARVDLSRPFATGLPAGFGDQAALVDYLERSHRPFDLTTDLALIEGQGPPLRGHRGVILAGSVRWITRSLRAALRRYVIGGGRVLSLGLGSLRAYVSVARGEAFGAGAMAGTDIFGISHGALSDGALSGAGGPASGGALTIMSDDLALFRSVTGPVGGFTAYEPITGVAAPAQLATSAGPRADSLSVAGVRLGSGAVAEVGLPGFASALATNAGARQLFGGMWSFLAG